VGRKLHLTLTFTEAHCAGEPVSYLCTDSRCLKDPCGGYDAEAPRLSSLGSAARSSRKKGGKSHGKRSKRGAKASEGELPAILLRGSERTSQVVLLGARNGTPTCRLVKGLDQVLVDAINKRVKIGERLGKSGERDVLHGHSLTLIRGLYVGGDVPGGPSHGYLRIHAKITKTKLKMTGAARVSQDAIRFGHH
jgi:hypothetical protein